MKNELDAIEKNKTWVLIELPSDKMSQNAVQHRRINHIKVKFHAMREFETEGLVKVLHCPIEEQLADLMTKLNQRSSLM